MQTSTIHRRFARRSAVPLVAGAVLYLLLVVAWQNFIVPDLPPDPFRPNLSQGQVLWAGPRNHPIYTREDIENADVLVIGDSRIFHGIVAERLEEAGLGRVAVVWCFGGHLTSLLAAVREMPPKRLVIGLAPINLHPKKNPVMTEIMRREPPSLLQEGGNELVAAWAEEELDYLVEFGFTRSRAEKEVNDVLRNLEQARLRSTWSPERVDLEFKEWFNVRRRRVVGTLSTRTWDYAWFWNYQSGESDDVYRGILSEETAPERAASLERVTELIQELKDQGREIVCLRVPVAHQLLEIEEAAFPGARFEELCKELEVPYLDSSNRPFRTRDGSHLNGPGADRYSRVVAEFLAEQWMP